MTKRVKQSSNKTIKVLIVAPAAPMIGGQAVQAQRIVDRFKDVPEIEVDLLPINPRFLPKMQEISGVRTIVTSTKYLIDLLKNVPQYDIIHVFSASYFSFVLAPTPAILIGKAFGKRLILNYHSGEAEDHLANWQETAFPLIRKVDRIIVPSGYLVDVFEKFGFRASAIYNFVETSMYKFRKREPVRPIFLSNRNFEELYNVECTIRAFALIQKEIPDSRLIVAGGGKLEHRLKATVKELSLKNVEFLGEVNQKEMVDAYDRADIYINSSNIDNMPSSIIEAFAAGLAVVSTDAGGIPYIVKTGKMGLLSPVGDYDALAKNALKLLNNPELAQEVIENARVETQKYSWENAKASWCELYEELFFEERI